MASLNIIQVTSLLARRWGRQGNSLTPVTLPGKTLPRGVSQKELVDHSKPGMSQ